MTFTLALPVEDADVRLEDFRIYGYKSAADGFEADLHDLVTAATIVRTIDGAPTLTIEATDPARLLADTRLLTYRITTVSNSHAFELAGTKKAGDGYSMVFEDVLVAEMRRRDTPRKVPAKTMSRVEFGYLLISELPSADFVTPPIPLNVALEELARGKDTVTPGAKPEDTWTALNRIFGAIKWRFWVDGGQIFAAPDTYLVDLPLAATIQERHDGIDDIDFDLDVGKAVQTATFTALSSRWGLPIGAHVEFADMGPAGGPWIISEFSRSLFSRVATVTAVRAVTPLAEPTQPATAITTPPKVTTTPVTGPLGTIGGAAPAGTYKAYAAKQAQAVYGWGPDQFAAIDEIWTAESGWDPNAQNPTSTAYGIAQFLDTTWATVGATKTSDGYRQIDAGLAYLSQRYGTPIQALQFRHVHGWY